MNYKCINMIKIKDLDKLMLSLNNIDSQLKANI